MAEHSTPIISGTLPNGSTIELLHDASARRTALAIGSADGSISIRDQIELPDGEVLTPYSSSNNLLSSGCVLLPSDVGGYAGKAALLEEVQGFLHRYVDLSPLFEQIASHYVLFSWVYDAFNEAPILRLRGEYGTGKTRALLAIGSLCYKAFFAAGASTVSPIFHIQDAFGGTLVLDEADFRFSDKTSDLVKILNQGVTRGFPVLRTMTNRHRELNPQAFRVFGPKIVAMRGRFEDEALESRFLTEEMGLRPLRPHIELTTPDALAKEAQALRNRLLAWRFAARSEMKVDATRKVEGLSARGNQMALPLLSLADDPELRGAIGAHLTAEEARARVRRDSEPQAIIVRELDRLFETEASAVPIAKLTATYNQVASAPLPIKSVGHIVRTRFGLETRKSRGVFVIPAHEREKVAQLAKRASVSSSV